MLPAARTKPARRNLFVVAALVERRGSVLLTQRRADQSFPLSWEFPGGKVEEGESPEEALVREIDEELGCRVLVTGVAELVFFAYPEFDLIMPVYRAKIVEGTPRAVQVKAMAWVARRDLATMPMPPADRPLAEKLAGTGQQSPTKRIRAEKKARRIIRRQRPEGRKRR